MRRRYSNEEMPEVRQAVQAMRELGMTWDQIGAEHGRSRYWALQLATDYKRPNARLYVHRWADVPMNLLRRECRLRVRAAEVDERGRELAEKASFDPDWASAKREPVCMNGVWHVPLACGKLVPFEPRHIGWPGRSLTWQLVRGYPCVRVGGQRRYVHQLVWECLVGPKALEDLQIDHEKHDTLDTRIVNTRVVTKSQNLRNLKSRGRHATYNLASQVGVCPKLARELTGDTSLKVKYRTPEEAAAAGETWNAWLDDYYDKLARKEGLK